jgi:hypothetical protein
MSVVHLVPALFPVEMTQENTQHIRHVSFRAALQFFLTCLFLFSVSVRHGIDSHGIILLPLLVLHMYALSVPGVSTLRRNFFT